MNVFDNSGFESDKANYAKEVKEKWGNTCAYKESQQKTSGWTKEKWDEVNAAMTELLHEFAVCKQSGTGAEDGAAQALVGKWQAFITENHYTCTKEILAGLGKMYVADERFRANIDRHGEGTAEFMASAIRIYCE